MQRNRTLVSIRDRRFHHSSSVPLKQVERSDFDSAPERNVVRWAGTGTFPEHGKREHHIGLDRILLELNP